jgi:hypothetical protein
MLQIARRFTAVAFCAAILSACAARPARAAEATIDDLQVDPVVYSGKLYANNDALFQGEVFAIQVQAKIGKQFTGLSLAGDLRGKMKPHAVFTATCRSTTMMFGPKLPAQPGNISAQGDIPTTLTLNGKLSAGGNAIVGTYRVTGAVNNKGTFWLEIAP